MCIHVLKHYRSQSNKPNKIDTPGLLYIILCGFQERMQSFQKMCLSNILPDFETSVLPDFSY